MSGESYRVRHILCRRTPPPTELNLPLIHFGVMSFLWISARSPSREQMYFGLIELEVKFLKILQGVSQLFVEPLFLWQTPWTLRIHGCWGKPQAVPVPSRYSGLNENLFFFSSLPANISKTHLARKTLKCFCHLSTLSPPMAKMVTLLGACTDPDIRSTCDSPKIKILSPLGGS